MASLKRSDMSGHHGNKPTSGEHCFFFWVGFVRLWWKGEAWAGERAAGERKTVNAWVGKKGGREVNGGKYRKQKRKEREMMVVIRIKAVGFGQSWVRAAMSVPTPHPSWLTNAKPQPKSAALAHAGSLHDTQAGSTWLCREHPKHTELTKRYKFYIMLLIYPSGNHICGHICLICGWMDLQCRPSQVQFM